MGLINKTLLWYSVLYKSIKWIVKLCNLEIIYRKQCSVNLKIIYRSKVEYKIKIKKNIYSLD